MNDLFFIYHVKDGFFWLLTDLNPLEKKISCSRFCPYLFTQYETADSSADIVRMGMSDTDIYIGSLSLLYDFIKSNSGVLSQ